MLEFELKRSRKGKRSRWSKKYPRKRISHRGDEKYAHWFPYNWTDDKYSYLCGDIERYSLSSCKDAEKGLRCIILGRSSTICSRTKRI